MRAGGTIDSTLVSAAQAGDRRAVDELVRTSLPLVYSIVRRVLDGPDADDVVQDVMVRALRRLPALRRPESFRSWLTAIAVHQIGTQLHRRAVGARRFTSLDEAVGMPDPAAGFDAETALRLDVSTQRRQVARAGYWLDPGDRVLLSLWLLEIAGEVTRADVATALGTSVAHAGVRVQRMRQQLEVSRELVTVLEQGAPCTDLDAAMADWDGVPSPLWRKRLARHVRSCPVCRPATTGLIGVERLLPGLALLPVPAALAAAVLTKSGTAAGVVTAAAGASGGIGVKAGIISQIAQILVTHPLVATVAVGAVAAGATVTATSLPGPARRAPVVAAAPSAGPVRPAPATATPITPSRRPASATPAAVVPSTVAPSAAGPPLVAGRPVSLESADRSGRFVTTADGLGVLAPAPSGGTAARRQMTFTVVTGVATAACFSFRAPDGRYLRHASWRFRLDPDQGTPLFRGDATFCAGPGTPDGAITLEASNYPGWFLHHRGDELWVDQTDGSAAFRAETSFRVRPARAG